MSEFERAIAAILCNQNLHCHQDPDGGWNVVWHDRQAPQLRYKARGVTLADAFHYGLSGQRLCPHLGCIGEAGHPTDGDALFSNCVPAGPRTAEMWTEMAAEAQAFHQFLLDREQE